MIVILKEETNLIVKIWFSVTHQLTLNDQVTKSHEKTSYNCCTSLPTVDEL